MSRSSGEPNASLSYSSARSQRYGSEFCMVTPEYLNAQQSRKLPVYTGLKPLHNYCMRRLGVVPAAGLLLITIVAFAPTIGSDFLLDDDVCVRGNETLRTPGGLAKIWLDPQSNQQYYPVVFSAFWVEYQFWGPNPTGYHLINILVHGVNAVLLWFVLRRL